MNLSKYMAKPDKTLREHTNELLVQLDILKGLGYIKDDKIYELSRVACEYHDYGKVNRYFQERVTGKRKKFSADIEIGHNILSVMFLDEGEYKKEDFMVLYNAILNHHNYVNNIEVLENEEELIEDNLEGFEDNIFEPYEDLAELKDYIDKETKELILVKGFLHRCDYSASAQGELEVEYKNDFLDKSLNGLLSKWIVDWEARGRKKEKPSWNKLQEYCKKNTDKNLIVIAQTGMGKTEAGLHWIGNNKGFFVLPLRTAINAIYERIIKEILDNKGIEETIALSHSDSLIHYLENNKKAKKENREEIRVMDYYSQTRNYAQPLSITTPDQIFDFVFKYPSYEMKATILSYSKIVIDEIQMYSPDLLSYLIYGLHRINKLGGKFCILTATLAPFIKDFIVDKVGPVFQDATFVDDSRRHHLKVIENELDVKLIKKNYEKYGKKILIVCNTIRKAQEVYNNLRYLNDGIATDEEKVVNLLHSKYTKEDRNKKEKKIIKFGDTANIDNGIWVATQVVEASLDIDFDYLYTELSDINGLFQRLGRCNRKGVKSVDKVNCYIYTNIGSRSLKTSSNSRGFIYEEIYNLSKDLLLEKFKESRIITEKEKVDIINRTFTTENIKGKGSFYSDFVNSYNLVENLYPGEMDKGKVKRVFRNILSKSVIPKDVYEINKVSIKEKLREIEESKNYLEKMQKIEWIKKFSVSLQLYEIDKYNEKIKLGKYEELEIADILYDKEYGVRKKPKSGIEQESNIF
ncbi:CRISPR-associated helicase Cas3' [Ilyobacter sp.]|uniref:CRISPR-associated helicase Cas3' n=1 Tax=Ilyobacter sp. TaxID=3100343 RepID=UPI0035678852